jgi:hypothetical protein
VRGRDLRHVIRATARIVQDQGEPDSIIVVIGSQAIHASYRDSVIPTVMTMSAEADLIVVTANATDLGEVRAAADILGHSPEMLMKTYSHALPESIRTVTNKIGERSTRALRRPTSA